jgi:broad specificity phosphatase PhoE
MACPFSAVWSSPSQRAYNTCVLAGFGAAASVKKADLAEWDYGAYEGLTTKQILPSALAGGFFAMAARAARRRRRRRASGRDHRPAPRHRWQRPGVLKRPFPEGPGRTVARSAA